MNHKYKQTTITKNMKPSYHLTVTKTPATSTTRKPTKQNTYKIQNSSLKLQFID